MNPVHEGVIARQVTTAIRSTSAVLIILMCGAFFAHDFFALNRTTLRQVTTLGQLVARNSSDALAFADPDAARDLLGALSNSPHVAAAGLYDGKGQLFARYPDRLKTGALPAAIGPDGYRFVPTAIEGFAPVEQKGRRLGTLYLRYDTGAIFLEWFRASAGIALVVIGGAFTVAYAISRTLGQRIAALEARDQARTAQLEAANAQLEAANRELESFSYSVSHDLRAPLRHIDGFAGMLRRRADPVLDPEGKRLLGTISDSAKRLGRLIDDLLAFSRINRAELTTVEIDHDALLAQVMRDGQFDRAPVEWSLSPLPRVRADPPMLRQVWANLLGNAVKYSAKAPHPRVAVTGRTEDGEHVFSVSDNGVGFDMAYAHKLFGVFSRLHGPHEFEGTGIGLANVRRIVMRHGGRAWAEGKVGEGATFHFSLPAVPPLRHE
jgi:signal transduction histidine kinase